MRVVVGGRNLSDAGSDVAKVWCPFITDKPLRVTTALYRVVGEWVTARFNNTLLMYITLSIGKKKCFIYVFILHKGMRYV